MTLFQAVRTKYIPPTNHRGSRIKASCQSMTLTLEWEDGMGVEDNHVKACDELCRRMMEKSRGGGIWKDKRACGQLPDGSCVHAFITEEK